MTAHAEHTINIFEEIFKTLPPLVPEEIVSDMQAALDQLRHNHSLADEEVEDTVIVFGRQVWPYRQAFQEFYELYEGKMGEQVLLQQLSSDLKKKYKVFCAHGGSFRALQAGGPFGYFTPDEQAALCEVLVETRRTLRQHARQAVVSTDKKDYLRRVYEFQEILDDIEKRLDTLRLMADNEQEHPELAKEIRAQVRGFELGLASLGPHTQYDAVCFAAEHFEGRKKEKLDHRIAA